MHEAIKAVNIKAIRARESFGGSTSAAFLKATTWAKDAALGWDAKDRNMKLI